MNFEHLILKLFLYSQSQSFINMINLALEYKIFLKMRYIFKVLENNVIFNFKILSNIDYFLMI